MNREISNVIKFVCCLLIFLHHYFLGNPFTTPLGTISCTIFFFLSSYGIARSIDNKNLDFWRFSKRRIIKIYIPLLAVNVFFILLTIILLEDYKIPVFGILKEIEWKELTLVNLFYFTTGIAKIDSVTWFLDYLLVSYVIIWCLMQIKSRKNRILYSCCIAIINLSLIKLFAPPIWETFDLIGLYLGFLYANVENHLIKLENLLVSSMTRRLCLVTFIAAYLVEIYINNIIVMYLSWFVYGLMAVLITTCTCKSFSLKHKNMYSFLGGLSYFVYLTHMKVIDIVYYIDINLNFIVSIVCTLAISHIMQISYMKIKI